MDIKLSNDKHVELVQNINTSAQAVNTDIKLPDLNSNMQGLIGIRNEVYRMKVSLERYKNILSNDSQVIIDAGNEIEIADFYAASKVEQSRNK